MYLHNLTVFYLFILLFCTKNQHAINIVDK